MNRTHCGDARRRQRLGARRHRRYARESTDSRPAGARRCSGPPDEDAVVRCALAVSPEVRQARAQLEAAIAGRAHRPGGAAQQSRRWPRRRRPPAAAARSGVGPELERHLSPGDRDRRASAARVSTWSTRQRQRGASGGGGRTGGRGGRAGRVLRGARRARSSALRRRAGADGRALAAYAEARAKEALVAGRRGGRRARGGDAHRPRPVRGRAAPGREPRRAGGPAGRRSAAASMSARGAPDREPAARPTTRLLTEQALRLRGEVAAAEMERQVLERRLAAGPARARSEPDDVGVLRSAARSTIASSASGCRCRCRCPRRWAARAPARSPRRWRRSAPPRAPQELVRRRVRLEVTRARGGVRARQGRRRAVRPRDLLARARADLAALREAIAARQLSLREGLQWQRSLIELLQADIDDPPGAGARLGRAASGRRDCRSVSTAGARHDEDGAHAIGRVRFAWSGGPKPRGRAQRSSGPAVATRPDDGAAGIPGPTSHEDETEQHEELPTKVQLRPEVVQSAGHQDRARRLGQPAGHRRPDRRDRRRSRSLGAARGARVRAASSR